MPVNWKILYILVPGELSMFWGHVNSNGGLRAET